MQEPQTPVNPTKRVPPTPRKHRAVKRPLVLDLLRRIYEDGGIAVGLDIDRAADGLPHPRMTCHVIADELEVELGFYEYMAAEYDTDRDLDPEGLRRLAATEATRQWLMTTGHLATQAPTGDRLLGAVDRDMAAERDYWRAKADKLKRELGPKFLNGTRNVRGQEVRNWIEEFRRSERLPYSKPPRR